MSEAEKKFCNDFGDRPGCLGEIDERFTMDFTDIEKGCYIYWCRRCGPEAHQMHAALNNAFETRPGFAEELKAAMDKAKEEEKVNRQ